MRKTLMRSAAVLAAATTLSMGAVGAAEARPGDANWRRCPAAHFCVYEHSDGRGRWGGTYHSKKNLADSRVWSGYMNDRITTIWVRRDEPWCAYEHANYKGKKLYLSPNRSYTLSGTWWNDRISSFREASRRGGKWVC